MEDAIRYEFADRRCVTVAETRCCGCCVQQILKKLGMQVPVRAVSKLTIDALNAEDRRPTVDHACPAPFVRKAGFQDFFFCDDRGNGPALFFERAQSKADFRVICFDVTSMWHLTMPPCAAGPRSF